MLKVLELFAGIGACSKALERLGIKHKIIDAVEIDKYAIQSFNAIHGTNFYPQDITKWDKNIEADLIMHGSPCQDFSSAGLGRGGDEGSGTRSSLMYESLRLINKLKPKYVIWENVPNILSAKHKHNFDAYIERMEEFGYSNHYAILNAKDFGVPQNRKRVYTVSILGSGNFKFLEATPLTKKLADVLETDVDEKYYVSDELANKLNIREVSQTVRSGGRGSLDHPAWVALRTGNKRGYDEAIVGDSVNLAYPNSKTRRGRVGHSVAQTLTANNNMGVIIPGLRIRKLTPLEYWRLMGFDDGDFEKASEVNSNTQLYKQAGNSIVVNVLEAILTELLLSNN